MEFELLSFGLQDKRILLGNGDEVLGLIQMLGILRCALEMATARTGSV